MRTIALEEHFISHRFLEIAELNVGQGAAFDGSREQLVDLGVARLKEMDEGDIDMQVISHTVLGYAALTTEQHTQLATAANNQLASAVAAHPDRYAGLATLPMIDPQAGARELDRAVTDLGFKGAMINGRTDGRFLDDPIFLPVLDRANALGVPIYLHPNLPTETLRQEYYTGFDPYVSFALLGPAWGWHAETGLHVLRMICAGIFDRFPDLQIIIGHMGEMIPFMLERIEQWLTPLAQRQGLQRTVAETFRSNFFVTTSGLFTTPPFMLLLQTVGADRILFSVDYPYSPIANGREFLDSLPASPADKAKISHLNAERLLGLPTA
jgi:hypothetical protein